jgi:four helix bundle protein
VSDFKKLAVWRKSHALMINVHAMARRIRGNDTISLRSQMLRAAMSVPANIVEGCGQKSRLDFARFLRFALNSASELEYHLIVARDLALIEPRDFASLSAQNTEVRKMLQGLVKRVISSGSAPPSTVLQ